MSSKIKHPRAAALEVARELTVALRELCEPERFIFAGSLRRMKAEVGDIEVVYQPRIEGRPDPYDMLGRSVRTNLVDVKLAEWLRAGVISKRVGEKGGTSWGEQNKLAVHTASGIGLDFFEAQAGLRNFWTLLVCRTGSAESNTRVCNAAIARGQRWNPYRGFEDRVTGALLFVPESEEALFNHVRLPFLPPRERV
jgi:DNA polymerase/3'-5' exonuclease PolX